MAWDPQEIERRDAEQRIYRSPLLDIGRFRARPDEACFRFSGVPGRHVFVFPRTSVEICHLDGEPFATDLNMVTFYNPDQIYFRRPISPAGDRCDWFALDQEVLFDLVASFDRQIDPAGEEIFRFPFGYSPAPVFLAERRLVAELQEDPDLLRVEETSIQLAERLLAKIHRPVTRRQGLGPAARAARRRLAARARELLLSVYAEPGTLGDLAGDLGCSVFHLSRVFRSETGTTLHAYRNQLRLRAALDLLLAGNGHRLVDIAFEVGFSSHSHFTAAFRGIFGMTPTAAGSGDIHGLAGRLRI